MGTIKTTHAEPPQIQAEVRPLSQEDLDRYWNETAEELSLQELMQQATVHLDDHPGSIVIDAQTVGFQNDFKPHRINIMERLRQKSSMPLLECKVNPLFVEKEKVLYAADEKYQAMLESNPRLRELRKLFPQIDI